MSTIHSIRSDAGGDYTSPQAWYDDLKGDITADANAPYIGELYGEEFASSLIMDSSTTDSTHYFHLRVDTDNGSNFTGSMYEAVLSGGDVPIISGFSDSDGAFVFVSDDYTRLEHFLVGNNTSLVTQYIYPVYVSGGDNVLVDSIGVYNVYNSQEDESSSNLYGIVVLNSSESIIRNCAIGYLHNDNYKSGGDSYVAGIFIEDSSCYIYNNSLESLVSTADGDSFSRGIYLYSLLNPSRVYNNVVGTLSGDTTECYLRPEITTDYLYDSYDAGEGWQTNPQYMVDNTDNAAQVAYDDANETELLLTNEAPAKIISSISDVEARAEGRKGGYGDGLFAHPIFNGTASDYMYTLTGITTSYSYGNTSGISDDDKAPSPWTWSDIQNLDLRIIAAGVSVADCYMRRVWVRVTYNETCYIDYNASSDSTASGIQTGSNSIDNITPTNEFVDTSTATMDLHIQNDTDCQCRGTGYDLDSAGFTGVSTEDIDNETRLANDWDIGCDNIEKVRILVSRITVLKEDSKSLVSRLIVLKEDTINLISRINVTPHWYGKNLPCILTVEAALIDIGIRFTTGGGDIKIGVEALNATHSLRISRGGTTYGVPLLDTSHPLASPFRIKIDSGIKALPKITW